MNKENRNGTIVNCKQKNICKSKLVKTSEPNSMN